MQELASLLPLVGIVLLFWLLVIRPAQRRQKATVRMQDSLQVGDEVMLTSGIFGTLRTLEEDRVRVEVADGVVLEVVRAAIGNVVPRADVTGGTAATPERPLGTEEL
ncbi:preprotein translocase subunit YajC [Nocardioides nanhaiensis]|uniref:Preprotein translocase subunit YajC n=1 Tax=Nocardioides nanhaiensis TaxID=1476871 RepID=A0ABP8WJQ2_9ACTN